MEEQKTYYKVRWEKPSWFSNKESYCYVKYEFIKKFFELYSIKGLTITSVNQIMEDTVRVTGYVTLDDYVDYKNLVHHTIDIDFQFEDKCTKPADYYMHEDSPFKTLMNVLVRRVKKLCKDKLVNEGKVKKKWKVICYTSKTTYDGQNLNELRYEQYKKLKEEFEYKVRFYYNTLEVKPAGDHTMVSMMCRECAYDGPVTVEFNVTDLPILPIDLEGGTADKVYRLDQVNYNDVLSEISKEMMKMYGLKFPTAQSACSSLSSVGFMYSDGSKLATYMNGESLSTTVNLPLPPANEFNDYDALRDMIKSVTINEKKRATTVVFKDGDVQIARCSKNDEYDKTVGISICIAAHLAGSKEKLKKFVKEITE